jgi:hypothetical protein
MALWEPSIGTILILGMGLRLVLLPWFSDPFNFWAGYLSSKILIQGVNPFSLFSGEPRFHQLGPWPYPAGYFVFTIGSFLGSDGSAALYPIWVRIPNIFADAGTAVLLFRIARLFRLQPKWAGFCATSYLLNPFVILVSAVWGTNDPIPVFFTVLALYFFVRGDDSGRHLGAFSLGLGIATKLYPLLFLPALLAVMPDLRHRLKVVAVAAVPPLLTSAPFLLSNPFAYLGIVFSFAGGTSGQNRGQLDPQFTTWRIASWFLGPLDARLAFVAAGALALGFAATYRRVRVKQLDLASAHGFLVMLAYLLAVRWSPSYFIWAVPFVSLVASRSLNGWKRWLALGFWTPALIYALIYNGWYPDLHSGGSGLSYWLLVSGVQGVRVFDSFPEPVAPVLVLATVLAVFFLAYLLIQPTSRLHHETESIVEIDRFESRGRNKGQTRVLAVLVAAFVAIFILSVGLHVQSQRPVGPTDFANFTVQPGGTVGMRDDFRADLLSFQWIFVGTGRYALHPNGTSGIVLDSGGTNGTASLQVPLSTETLSVRLAFRIDSYFGNEPIGVLRTTASQLEVRPVNGRGGTLLFLDTAANRSYALGTVSASWVSVGLASTPANRTVDGLGSHLVLPPSGPVESVEIGPAAPYRDGGGRLVVGEVAMIWQSPPGSIAPLAPSAVVILDLAALGVLVILPALLSRFEKSLAEGDQR